MSQASFNFSGSDDISSIVNDTLSFLEDGSVDIIATGLFARLELGVDVNSPQGQVSLPMSLPPIPFTPFVASKFLSKALPFSHLALIETHRIRGNIVISFAGPGCHRFRAKPHPGAGS